MKLITRLLTGAALAGLMVRPLAAEPHVAKGLTLELVAAEAAVVPGRPVSLGVTLRPDAGFHTYWRQPGLVGLTPTIEWSLPAGFKAGDLLWPEPQRGQMAAYGVWCLKRETCLVAPVTVPATLDPSVTPTVTIKARVVWMACSRTCHPGNAELALTLPVRAQAEAGGGAPAAPGAVLIAQTRSEQPVEDQAWTFAAVQDGPQGGFSLTITPPAGRHVPDDAYFYGHQRLVDSNVEPVRHDLPGGAVRLDLALVEESDPIPQTLVGELWSAEGWGAEKAARLLMVRAPLVTTPAAK
jgi:DsbC/DsbD-like thiol-disulfide interchange protein